MYLNSRSVKMGLSQPCLFMLQAMYMCDVSHNKGQILNREEKVFPKHLTLLQATGTIPFH